MNCLNAFLVGTMSTAINTAAGLDPMPDYFTPTMFALRRQGVDGALEAIEIMRDARHHHLYGFVIFVTAYFTSIHILFLSRQNVRTFYLSLYPRLCRFKSSRVAFTIWSCSASSTPSSTSFSAKVCSSGVATVGAW